MTEAIEPGSKKQWPAPLPVHPADFPSLTIVAEGSINVSSNVSELDGTFIAEDGNFNDCYDYTNVNDLYSQCNKQLVVYGAVLSNGTVNLYRTNGTLHESSTTETSSSPYPAEIFNYSPLTWLSTSPTLTDLPINAQASLPPIL